MTAGDRSLHVGLFFYPLTVPRVLDLLMRDLTEQPAARRPIRGDADESGGQEALLKALLRERIEALSLDELRAAHRTVALPDGVV